VVNIIAPFGAQDIGRREGGSPQFGLTRVNIGSSDVTPIFNGDIVQNGVYEPVSGGFGKYVTQASSGLTAPPSFYEGVFRGCEYFNAAVGRQVWSNFWPGSAGAGSPTVDAIAYIDNDPSKYFIAQASTVASSSGWVPIFTSSMVGINVAFGSSVSSGVGNTTTGFSGAAVLSSISLSSLGATSSYAFRLIDFYGSSVPNQQGYVPGGGFVNGTDNGNVGQILVLAINPTAYMPTSSGGV
jgi:hypothetical protein